VCESISSSQHCQHRKRLAHQDQPRQHAHDRTCARRKVCASFQVCIARAPSLRTRPARFPYRVQRPLYFENFLRRIDFGRGFSERTHMRKCVFVCVRECVYVFVRAQ